MTSTQATILACVIVICGSVLVAMGKVHIPEGATDKLISAVVAFILGWGLPRPDALKRALGVPTKSPEIPITFTGDDK